MDEINNFLKVLKKLKIKRFFYEEDINRKRLLRLPFFYLFRPFKVNKIRRLYLSIFVMEISLDIVFNLKK